LPDELAVAEFASEIKVFGKVERIAADASDDLPTDAQLAELQHTFAQRLAEFEASGWSDSAPQPGLSRSAPPVLAPWPSALPASSTLWRPGCSQSG